MKGAIFIYETNIRIENEDVLRANHIKSDRILFLRLRRVNQLN